LYDWILPNPPYHADFRVPKQFIENGFSHLKCGGRMVMVTKRYKWYKNKLESVFGGVKLWSNGSIFITKNRKAGSEEPAIHGISLIS